MDILQIYKDIFSLLTPLNKFIYRDYIPDSNSEIDLPKFSKGEYGVYFVIEPTDDIRYRQDLNLQVVIVGAKEYKPQAQQKALDMDKVIDRAMLNNFRIKKANAWAYTVDDGNETNVVMQYRILDYK